MKFIFTCLTFLWVVNLCFAKSYELKSPDNHLKVVVNVLDKLSCQVYVGDEIVLDPSTFSMEIEGVSLGVSSKVKRVKKHSVNNRISFHVKRKFAEIDDNYNELIIDFKGNYSLIWRAYNEGLAYRWKTNFKNDVIVASEEINFNFPADHKIWFPEEESIYTHQEREYIYTNLSEITPERFASTGLLVELENGRKMFISESDLEDYPGMFLEGSSTNDFGLTGKFSAYPLEEEKRTDRDVFVTKYEDFIAKTKGVRTYPWRLMIISDNDAELLTTELVYKLAKPLQLEDVSWIKPGKVAWDWWNALNVYGVDFKSGVNTATYKYFIDFASKYNLEYIILDEGWYELDNLLEIESEVDLEEIIEYGNKKNVGVILWTTWKALEDNTIESFEKYSAMGAKGFKVDFMQRDDQWMVDYYHRIAKIAADYKMLIDYHGSYKPTGLRRAYPNVITREGVNGLEQTKWGEKANPENSLILPFTRMVSGPMDYTPGAMINKNKTNFTPCFTEPASAGTRCHQLAMYVVFESPLQMLADNPSNYLKEKECMEFLSPVPTVWDDTKVLAAKISDYVLLARRSDKEWYLGAMSDWDERQLDAKLDFLGDGEFTIEIWQDGVNANKHASDYKKIVSTVTKDSILKINIASGGGWAARISPKN